MMHICNTLRSLFLASILTLGTTASLLAQLSAPANWFNLDPERDRVNGVSSERTYQELLKGKQPTTIVVAVIDGGVDPMHEDLKDVMWINRGEIPGNGIDDDGNGYIDDIYGWNFIGGKDGSNVHHDTYEITRIVQRLDKAFENPNTATMSKDQRERYEHYLTLRADVERQQEKAHGQAEQYDQIRSYVRFALSAARDALGDTPVTRAAIDRLDANEYGMVKAFFVQLLPQMGDFEGTVADLEKSIVQDLDEAFDNANSKIEYGYNTDFDPRHIVNDNYEDVNERFYGNADVKGPDAFHGTHVAGIIAATRTNDLGIMGVADKVQIMAIRAVPDGDERDKDVANAIRYAVDNGAHIINMSFGKGFSPEKKAVERAIRYAEKKNVLLVHAAGNSSQDNDAEDNYPNASYDYVKRFLGKKYATNWIEVGALAHSQGEGMVASFSNFGQNSVDLFAPGQQIYSTAPDGEYREASGTSMAAPVVAGVAAVIKSYFPALTARQIKTVLTQSARPYTGMVRAPGSGDLVPFRTLSQTGGVVNLRSAVLQAMVLTRQLTPEAAQQMSTPRA